MIEYIATENIPTWAMCYIEYGSSDTLTDEEVKMIDEFLDSYGFPIIIEYGEEEFFTSCPAFGLPCDCVEGKIYKA